MHRLGRSLLVTQNVLQLGAAGRICSSLQMRRREVSFITPFRRKQESSLAVPKTNPEKTVSSDLKSTYSERRIEKFIPVTRGVLLSKLTAEDRLLNWQERRLLESFAAALDAFFSRQFYAMLEETKVRSMLACMVRFNWNHRIPLAERGVATRDYLSPFFFLLFLVQ